MRDPIMNYTNDENIEGIKEINGLWMGSLKLPNGLELRILFNISLKLTVP